MKPKIIWGADAIGRVIGRSPDFIRRTLSARPDSPVHRFGRRYWAYEDELTAYFARLAKQKPN